MECVLCALWAKLPYHKRWSTPVTPQQAEEVMIIGYWTRANNEGTAARMCERHLGILNVLNSQEEKRRAPTIPTLSIAQQIMARRQVQQQPPQPAPPVGTMAGLSPEASLGLFGVQPPQRAPKRIIPQAQPINNGNMNTAPPAPAIANPAEIPVVSTELLEIDFEPTITVEQPPPPPRIEAKVWIPAPKQEVATIGSVGAQAPVVDGGSATPLPCPLCGKDVKPGEVHAC